MYCPRVFVALVPNKIELNVYANVRARFIYYVPALTEYDFGRFNIFLSLAVHATLHFKSINTSIASAGASKWSLNMLEITVKFLSIHNLLYLIKKRIKKSNTTVK